ncbi:MAG: sigma-54 dependent transcriptional regulator [Melioribacteraceae bacterium]
MKIIIIEDEKTKRITMNDALIKDGYNVESFEDPVVAINYLKESEIDLVITDIRLPQMDGFEVLQKVKEMNQNIAVVMMTAFGTIESAVEAMKLGAYDYLTKPFSTDQLLLLVKKISRFKKLEEENVSLKEKFKERYSFHNIIGKSKPMQDLYDLIETISSSDVAVLIEGGSGTGKEMVANAIHYNSTRKDGPFIKLSCALLNESLLESELFGHEKGAFTGAIKFKKGRFELAHSGTIFLDDVDDIPISSQVKLLRLLQEKEFERVGGNTTIKTDVRFICATKVDLWEKVKLNQFREDLYYRLRVIPVKLPPLRERREDIPLLIDHFLKKVGKTNLYFTPEAIELLTSYNWPGNVRQLENSIYRITALIKGKEITKEMIPNDLILPKDEKTVFDISKANQINLDKMIQEIELSSINWAVEKSDHNQSKAAELLGIKRTTLRDKMKKYNLL